jgi:hypothetical protein
MEVHEIKHLLERYYEGNCSLSEEILLREQLTQSTADELEDDRRYLKAVDGLRKEKEYDFFLPDRFMLKVQQEETENEQREKVPRRNVLAVAASIGLLLIGFGGGVFYEKENMPRNEVVAIKQEVSEMKRMLMFNQLNRVSASERIMAVQKIKSADELDTQILETLIYTVNADPNANVRMAVVGALAHFSADSTALRALKASLTEQNDPLVQIAILDVLVEQNQRDAVNEIQQLLQQDDLEQEVRQQAELGLSRLL